MNNSGNDTAYNLHILPTIYNTTTSSSYYTISSLAPENSYVANILLSNITANGTYLDYITVSYQQGSSVFSALFPCLEDFFTPTQSQIILTDNITQNNGVYNINVSTFNAGRSLVYVNDSIILPPGFTYLTPTFNRTEINGLNHTSIIFRVKGSSSTGSYSGAIASSYVENGLMYSTFLSIVLALNSSGNTPSSGISLFYIVIIVVIALFVILIIRALLMRKKHHMQ